MTRVRTLLAAALVAVPAAAALGPRYGGEAAIGVPSVPRPGAPAFATAPLDRTVLALTHETLVRAPGDGIVEPGLARTWASAADGREWTLTLAPDLRFHDGAPVTAADAVRSLRRFLRSASPAAERWADTLAGGRAYRARLTEDLPGLAAPDATRVVLRLTAPVAAPLAPLAAAAAAVTGSTGAGAGPFVPGARSDRRLELTAFAAHVRGRPYLDRVAFVQVADEEAAVELDAGRVQVVLAGPGTSPPAAMVLLLLDRARGPFADAAVRAGALASIDARQLVEHLVPGGEVPASLLPPDLLTPLPPAAPPAARALSGRATLSVGLDVPAAVSQRVVACFADRGLAVTVQPTDPLQARAAAADARLVWWAPEVAEPGLALRELASLARADASVTDALAAAEAERDPDRRRALHHRAESGLRDASLAAALARAPLPFRARGDLHGLRVDAAAALLLEDAWRAP